MRQLCRTVILALYVAACDSTGPNVSLARELALNRLEWQNQHIHEYTFDYNVACYCLIQPVRIVVLADTVRSAILLSTGAVYAVAGTAYN